MGKRRASPFEAPPYNREGNRKARRKAMAERVQATAMLLGATWVGDTWADGYFMSQSRNDPNTGDFRGTRYWDRNGKPMSAVQAQARDKDKLRLIPVTRQQGKSHAARYLNR